MSAIYHGILLCCAWRSYHLFLNLIPLSALAAILIYTGFKLAKPSIFTELYKKGSDQFIPFVATVVVIIFTDLLIGITDWVLLLASVFHHQE